MKTRYIVINTSNGVMQGSVDVDGESVQFQRSVLRVDLMPEGANDHHSSVMLALHGPEIEEARRWKRGDVIEGEFRKV